MSDLRGIGRSVEELLALKKGAAGGSAFPPIKRDVLQGKHGENQTAQGRKLVRESEGSVARGKPGDDLVSAEPDLSENKEETRSEDNRFSSDLFGQDEDASTEKDDGSWPNRKPQRVFKSFEEELLFAKEKALRLLGDMDRTKKELSERLARTGVGEEAIRKTIDYLERYNYLDDARYARHYFARFSAERGVRRIRMELQKKGVDKETLTAILSEEGDAEAENEKTRCAAIAQKRAAGQDLSDPKARSRLYAYLARRGFREADIWAAVREIAEKKGSKEVL